MYRTSVPKTACPWGLSSAEAKRFGRAQAILEQRVRAGGFVALYLVIDADALDDAAWLAVVRDVARVIVKIQDRFGMRPTWLEVREGTGSRHANIVFLLPADVVAVVFTEQRRDRYGVPRDVLRVSCAPLDRGLTGNKWTQTKVEQPQRFARYNREPETVGGRTSRLLDLQMVTDFGGLASYLLKEQSPQASRATGIPRRKGSHKISVGGDRVRMCADLHEALLRAGVPDWTKTYSKPGRGLKKAEPQKRAEVAKQPKTKAASSIVPIRQASAMRTESIDRVAA